MLDPIREKPLKTIDEVFDSDFKIADDGGILYALHQDNPKFQKAHKEQRIVDHPSLKSSNEHWTVRVEKGNLAIVQPCKLWKNYIVNRGDGKSCNGLYMIPEVLLSKPEDLYTRPYHPYLELFQRIMDHSFEIGLHQIWEDDFFKISNYEAEGKEKPEAKLFLDFASIGPFFLILAVGFATALLSLMCEVFCDDFVSNISRDYLRRKFNEIFRRNRIIRVRKVRRKIIQVRPRTN